MIEKDEGAVVEVPFEYFLELHTQINASFEKLKELIGEPATRALFALSADQALPGLQPSPSTSIEKLKEILEGANYRLEEARDGDVVEFALECPFAKRIHPRLDPGASYCPMSETVLSTIRKRYPKSVVVSSRYVDGGSVFSVRIEPLDHEP